MQERVFDSLRSGSSVITLETPEQQEGLIDLLSVYLASRTDPMATAYVGSAVDVNDGKLAIESHVYIDGGVIVRGVKKHGGFINRTEYANSEQSGLDQTPRLIRTSMNFEPKLGTALLLGRRAEEKVSRAMATDNPGNDLHSNIGETLWRVLHDAGSPDTGLVVPRRIGLHIEGDALQIHLAPPIAT